MKIKGSPTEIVIFIVGLAWGLLIINNEYAITSDKISAIMNIIGLFVIITSSYCLGISATLIYINSKQELK